MNWVGEHNSVHNTCFIFSLALFSVRHTMYFIYILSVFIVFLLNSNVSSVISATSVFLPTCPQCLEQCLEHSKFPIDICWMNEYYPHLTGGSGSLGLPRRKLLSLSLARLFFMVRNHTSSWLCCDSFSLNTNDNVLLYMKSFIESPTLKKKSMPSE